MKKVYDWISDEETALSLAKDDAAVLTTGMYKIWVEEMGEFFHFVVEMNDVLHVQATIKDDESVFEPNGFFPVDVKKELTKRLRDLRKQALALQYEQFIGNLEEK